MINECHWPSNTFDTVSSSKVGNHWDGISGIAGSQSVGQSDALHLKPTRGLQDNPLTFWIDVNVTPESSCYICIHAGSIDQKILAIKNLEIHLANMSL